MQSPRAAHRTPSAAFGGTSPTREAYSFVTEHGVPILLLLPSTGTQGRLRRLYGEGVRNKKRPFHEERRMRRDHSR